MSLPYTPQQLVDSALKAHGEGNETAAQGILTLLAIHYPDELAVLMFALDLRNLPSATPSPDTETGTPETQVVESVDGEL